MATSKTPEITPVMGNSPNTYDIPLGSIVVDPSLNYRKQKDPKAQAELQESMKRQGQLQSVEVTQMPNGKFGLNLGFRRYDAAKALGWPTIRCEVAQGDDGKAHTPKERKVRNLAENLARENLTTFDQAQAFMDLKKEEDMSTNLIGQNTGKSVSYINNLVRVYELLDESILKRWQEESNPTFGLDSDGKPVPNIRQVCTINWLQSVVKVPKAEQEHELHKALGLIEDDDATDGDGDGDSNRDPTQPGAPKRASMPNLKKAMDAAKKKQKDLDKDSANYAADKAQFAGIIAALKFAIGDNQSIKGVYTSPKPGEKAEDSADDDDE